MNNILCDSFVIDYYITKESNNMMINQKEDKSTCFNIKLDT